MPSISYAITAHNEHKELDRLLSQLDKGIRDIDRVVIQVDATVTGEVLNVINKYPAFTLIQFPLNGDFASFKNNLKSKCTGEWIFQIDADEYLHPSLLKELPDILASNPTTDLFLVPRVNTVEGLTQEHIQKWRWNVNENGWINYPDYQTRILQNHPKIKWVSKVHEVITGHSTYAMLPAHEEYSLIHPKHINRQEAQNAYYDTLQQLNR
jgi:glycosyltransferase involved in cell wall biosynthesis